MRRTRNEWAAIVGRLEASGLSARKFSQREGLSEQSLRNWIRRLGQEGPDAISRSATAFVEIRSAPSCGRTGKGSGSRRDHGLTIRLPNGARIEVRSDTDRATLEWVLAVMGGGA